MERDDVANGHIEVERKYDVDRDFALPDPGELGAAGVVAVDEPVEHELEAVYHDSADLRLAGARMTLRRRTGGPDAGWHLKLPAADGARREVHAPLGRAVTRPPRTVLDPVRGILRGAPTAPVATLRNHRTVTVLRDAAGRALAEVADDTVTASASGPDGAAALQAWREVEVELVEGDESLLAPLGEWLTAAGARPSASASKLARVLASRAPVPADGPAQRIGKKSTAGTVVLAALRAEIGALQTADVALRLDDPDAVHGMRVAARRLRSMLASFGALLERPATDPLREELSWLGGELGQARDDEVALGHLCELVAELPPEVVVGPVAARLEQTAQRATAQGRERGLATLGDARYLRLLDSLHGLVEDPPWTPAAGERARVVLRAALHKAGKRLRRRIDEARRADGAERDAALHDVRKAAKRARYTAEVLTADRKSGARRVVTTAKRVQEALGTLQDTVVTRELCRRLAAQAAADGENAFTFGVLHGREADRADRARDTYAAMELAVRSALRSASRS